ncbi:MAG: glycosyltransferase family 2 protein [Deltaproteobacteria bacterium]|nr:glycosyltransferase family 2 protein [Deltaproteobacteria bacterium]
MNILVLMAGSSAKFREAGYIYPKNLIELNGTPLVELFINELKSLQTDGNNFIFTLNGDEDDRYYTGAIIQLLLPGAQIVKLSSATAGAACTALLAVEQINNEEPLVIINGDIFGDLQIKEAIAGFQRKHLDGGLIVFEGVHPRWSYVRCDGISGLVVEAAEKRPISKLATIGVYYFAHGRDFVTSAMNMIVKDANVDGKYYVCPSYNEMILAQKKIGTHQIPRKLYFSLATPQGVTSYEEYLKSRLVAIGDH